MFALLTLRYLKCPSGRCFLRPFAILYVYLFACYFCSCCLSFGIDVVLLLLLCFFFFVIVIASVIVSVSILSCDGTSKSMSCTPGLPSPCRQGSSDTKAATRFQTYVSVCTVSVHCIWTACPDPACLDYHLSGSYVDTVISVWNLSETCLCGSCLSGRFFLSVDPIVPRMSNPTASNKTSYPIARKPASRSLFVIAMQPQNISSASMESKQNSPQRPANKKNWTSTIGAWISRSLGTVESVRSRLGRC